MVQYKLTGQQDSVSCTETAKYVTCCSYWH